MCVHTCLCSYGGVQKTASGTIPPVLPTSFLFWERVLHGPGPLQTGWLAARVTTVYLHLLSSLPLNAINHMFPSHQELLGVLGFSPLIVKLFIHTSSAVVEYNWPIYLIFAVLSKYSTTELSPSSPGNVKYFWCLAYMSWWMDEKIEIMTVQRMCVLKTQTTVVQNGHLTWT